MEKIINGDQALSFMLRYKFWAIQHATSGRIEIVIRDEDGEYVKVWSRKQETIYQVIERLRSMMEDASQPATKPCAKCHQVKPFVEFGKANRTKDGLATQCRDCRRAATKKAGAQSNWARGTMANLHLTERDYS